MLIFSLLLNMQSHPTWVRGLKQKNQERMSYTLESHPTWVRGLKQLWLKRLRRKIESHPTWVRGLKLQSLLTRKIFLGRTLRGCVD